MDDTSERFLQAINALDSLAEDMPPDEAHRALDDATLQVFWRSWTDISSWAGQLWRRLNEDLQDQSRPPSDPEMDEVGDSGGG